LLFHQLFDQTFGQDLALLVGADRAIDDERTAFVGGGIVARPGGCNDAGIDDSLTPLATPFHDFLVPSKLVRMICPGGRPQR
jgi:hypothetical protein